MGGIVCVGSCLDTPRDATVRGSAGQSHNLGVHGTLTIDARTPTEVRGSVDLRATPCFSDSTVGALSGPFVAPVTDCADHDGRWPL